jgi:hypothetical protein
MQTSKFSSLWTQDEIEKARDLIVEWLKDDESENDVDGESPLKVSSEVAWEYHIQF